MGEKKDTSLIAKKEKRRFALLVAGITVIWLGIYSIGSERIETVQTNTKIRRAATAAISTNEYGGLYEELRKNSILERNTIKNESSQCPDIIALTYASHGGRDDRFCRSLESAIRNGVDLQVLGWGIKWEGLSQKLGAALDAVRALPSECVVLFTDAYDVLFTQSPKEMRRKFEALNKPLIFSGECGCWPQVQRDNGRTCRDKYPLSPTPFRYLNSGSWMGRAGVAAEFLARLVKDAGLGSSSAFHKLNDQELAAELYFSGEFGTDRLGLDHYATLFMPMHAVNDKTMVPNCDPRHHLTPTGNGIFINTLTKSTPAVYHFNGGGKKHHLPMEAQMWWKHCSDANTPELQAAVESTKLQFHKNRLPFAQVCPNHLQLTRLSPSKERHCYLQPSIHQGYSLSSSSLRREEE
uniref:PLOD1-3-like GT domain-containing protein n=1 Tax=Aureoumbra lagunensis TaxID=44058 RepID=A0A7S3K3N4_9STRA|mmetsp:Transcript_11879/g.17792  ORF Transcript_11879/g.17792 Transcript_11879/m.17792 type:complete len:409 (+) Transcript_11879:9-1235(+)